jgi:hypothetical protein
MERTMGRFAHLPKNLDVLQQGDGVVVLDSDTGVWRVGIFEDFVLSKGEKIGFRYGSVPFSQTMRYSYVENEWRNLDTKSQIRYECESGCIGVEWVDKPSPQKCPVCDGLYVKAKTHIRTDSKGKVLEEKPL